MPALEYIGYSGSGAFSQSGGTNRANSIILASNPGSSGSYNLNGGLLVTASLSQALGTATFNFGGGTLQPASSMSSTLAMTLTGSGGNACVNTGGFGMTLSAPLSGPGGLIKAGSGALILSATNTYSGNTLVSGGTLVVASPLALQDSTLDTSGSGKLSFGNIPNATFGGLSGSGTLNLFLSLNVGSNNANTTFSGALNGFGFLTKIGSGTLTLSGSNANMEPTTVSQGKLVVDGWLTNSAVSVSSGTLGGSGHLSSVAVSPGGTLAPGDSQGVMQLSGNLTLLSGAAMDYEFDGSVTDDEVSMPTGTLSLNNQQFSDFNFTPLAGFGQGTYTLIVAGSVSGNLASNSGMVGGYAATLAVQGNDLVLNVVPEPCTLVLLAAGTLGLLGYGLRRKAVRGCEARGLRPARRLGHPLLPIAFVPCSERGTTGSLIRNKSKKSF